MATQHNGLPSKPAGSRTGPRYSIQSFGTSYAASSYSSYSDSITDPVTEYAYGSSNIASSPTKHSTPESFGSRVFNTFSDAVKKSPNNFTNPSPPGTTHSRTRSIVDSPGAMLARTTSIRLSGLLNRTPTSTPKQQPPTEEQDEALSDTEDMPTYTPTFSGTPRRRSGSIASPSRNNTPSRPPTGQANKPGRFAWFSAPKSSDTTLPRSHTFANLTSSLDMSDPLLSLNVSASLFPSGPADAHDPASFNDLVHHATALAERLQSAYRERASHLRQARAERDAAAEETEEAATRAAHLKSQLETLAAKAAEQQRAMQEVATQLSREREARAEDEAELAALRRWKKERQLQLQLQPRADSVLEAAAAVANNNPIEDDGSTPRRRRSTRRPRSPPATRLSDGDSGFESDVDHDHEAEAESESLCFSLETASTASGPVTPGWQCVPTGQQGWERESEGPRTEKPATSAAWGVVGDLQRENWRLKTRVRELEGAVEGCLAMVA